jgi:membrane dipeptidase
MSYAGSLFVEKGGLMKNLKVFGIFAIMTVFCLAYSADQAKTGDADLMARARALHRNMLTVDTHSDTSGSLLDKEWNIAERHQPGQRDSTKVDLPRMKEGGLDAEFFSVFVGQGELTPEGYEKARERALVTLDAVHKMCEDHADLIGLALTPDDAIKLKKQGKLAAFIGMENGYPVGRNLAYLEEYYKKGIRYLTLCHGGNNDICSSSSRRDGGEDYGLTDFGKQVVAACNRLGIMVDVSHISDKSFFDVLAAARAPIIASHSGCRALAGSSRNLTDDQLRALAKNGGVIQVVFLGSYLRDFKPNPARDEAIKELQKKFGPRREIKDEAVLAKYRQEMEEVNKKYPQERATVKDVVDHIDHVVKTIGIDYVGIGTDFDGGGGVVGCDDASEMINVTVELMRRGYSDKDITKIWSGNLFRVFNKVIEIANASS